MTGALEHGGHPHDPERRIGRFDVDAVHVELRWNDEQHAARGSRPCEYRGDTLFARKRFGGYRRIQPNVAELAADVLLGIRGHNLFEL